MVIVLLAGICEAWPAVVARSVYVPVLSIEQPAKVAIASPATSTVAAGLVGVQLRLAPRW